jgi:hypothetical protein
MNVNYVPEYEQVISWTSYNLLSAVFILLNSTDMQHAICNRNLCPTWIVLFTNGISKFPM